MKYINIFDVMVYLNKDAGDYTIVLIIIDSALVLGQNESTIE